MSNLNPTRYEEWFAPELIQAVVRGERQDEFAANLLGCIAKYVAARLAGYPEADTDSICSELRTKIMSRDRFQEVMVKGQLDFIRFLCVTMSNFVCDKARQLVIRRAHAAKSLDEPAGPDPEAPAFGDSVASAVDVRREIESRELSALIERFIDDHLSEQEAILLRLRVIHGLSYEELATELGDTVSNVGVRWKRIRDKIKTPLRAVLSSGGYDL